MDTLPKFHADFKLAAEELTSIFGKLSEKAAYPTIDAFKDAVHGWFQKYSTSSDEEKLNDKQKVEYLGMLFKLF